MISARVTFKGTKTVENLNLLGRVLQPNEFMFEIQEVDANDKVLSTAYAYNDADGNIVYPTIRYTLADVGVHTYKVRELEETIGEIFQ